MSQPSPKLLSLLLTFIGATVFGAWGRAFGTPGMVIGSLVGTAAGWLGARWLMQRMF